MRHIDSFILTYINTVPLLQFISYLTLSYIV